MRRFANSAAIVLSVVITQSALAHEPAADCARIADDSARLACYDAASGRRGAAPTPVTPTAPATAAATAPSAAAASVNSDTPATAASATPAAVAAATPAAPATPATVAAAAPAAATATASSSSTATFGLNRELREEVDKLSGTIVSVGGQAHYGRWVVTLDNGQVWEQRETTPESRRPKPGDVVTIKKASLGSYLLSAPNRGSSRVRRVQ